METLDNIKLERKRKPFFLWLSFVLPTFVLFSMFYSAYISIKALEDGERIIDFGVYSILFLSALLLISFLSCFLSIILKENSKYIKWTGLLLN